MVYSGRAYPRYRRGGRFFGRRVNCEQVPLLPGWVVGRVLDDPRQIPYLLIWRNRSDGTVQEAVRVTSYGEPPNSFSLDWTGWIEIKRPYGSHTLVRSLLRPLPRHGGKARLLVCPCCQVPRRALYGWQAGGQYTNSAQTFGWQCRSCAGLRYSSEGSALVLRGRGFWFHALEAEYGTSRSPRPERWLPEVFNSCRQMAEAGFCSLT